LAGFSIMTSLGMLLRAIEMAITRRDIRTEKGQII
jgi:hypothetical protein